MNIRKPVDYSAMFRALDDMMSASLPQMELYREIGQLVSDRPEKGAAVAAAEYLSRAYPDASGFSPRNLRRMRDFYKTYEGSPDILAEAMTIGWTQNVTISESCESLKERVWYIRAARQFGWTKSKLLEKIHDGACLESSSPLLRSYQLQKPSFRLRQPSEVMGGSVCIQGPAGVDDDRTADRKGQEIGDMHGISDEMFMAVQQEKLILSKELKNQVTMRLTF